MKEYHLEGWKKMQFLVVEDRVYDSSIAEDINTTYELAHIKSVQKLTNNKIMIKLYMEYDSVSKEVYVPVKSANDFMKLWKIFKQQIGHVMLLVEPDATRLKTSDIVVEKGKDKPVWAFVSI